MSLVSRLLKNTEWSRATDYLSPVFFQVVPTVAMAKKVGRLAASYADHASFAKLCAERSEQLKPVGIMLDLAPISGATIPLGESQEFKVLTLYFWQLIHTDTPILDLRQSAFSAVSSGELRWAPKPLSATFDPAFAQAIRDMYLGFYTKDFPTFDRALVALDLFHAKDLFLNHFGGSQASMVFDLVKFRKTFHDLFVSCKNSRTRLHPDFLAFGAGLFCLYEHLERNKRLFDVKAAFETALAWKDLGQSD